MSITSSSRGMRTVMLTLVDGSKECMFSIYFRILRAREFIQEGLKVDEGANQNSVSFFFIIFVTSSFYAFFAATVLLLFLIFYASSFFYASFAKVLRLISLLTGVCMLRLVVGVMAILQQGSFG